MNTFLTSIPGAVSYRRRRSSVLFCEQSEMIIYYNMMYKPKELMSFSAPKQSEASSIRNLVQQNYEATATNICVAKSDSHESK